MDFEYQAFHFALRRTLEYTAQLVGYSFGTQVSSFRKLKKGIADKQPELLVKAAVECHSALMERLADLIPPKDERQSVRDRIAHYNDVKFGTLNVSWEGDELKVFVAGGGHKANREIESLAKVLTNDLMLVETAVFDLLRSIDFPSGEYIRQQERNKLVWGKAGDS